MSECANCNVSVYVPDGYEFEEGDLCMSCTKAKADRLQALVDSADERNGSMMWRSDHDKILARQEEQWKTWGVIEIAVRNPNVQSYMSHWEKRTVGAEAMVESVHRMLADRRREIDLLTIETDLMADWIRKHGGVTSHYKEMAEAQYGPKSERTL